MNKIYIHFSIDDILNDVLCLDDKNLHSIFDRPTFDFAKRLWDRNKIKTTMNVFYEGKKGNISEVQNHQWREVFEENSDWLKFSFHGRNSLTDYKTASYENATNDYKLVQTSIENIAGNDSFSNIVRLHYFSGSKECMQALVDQGVQLFLCADDNRGSYSLLPEDEAIAKKNIWYDGEGKCAYLGTDIRLESCSLDELTGDAYDDRECLVIFTHAKYISTPEIMDKMFAIVDFLATKREVHDFSELFEVINKYFKSTDL